MSAVSGNGKRRRSGPRTSTEQEKSVKEASRLRLRGLQWEEIAGLTGYPSAAAAHSAVNLWQQKSALEMSIDERREALREAVQGCDALIAHWYDDALEDLAALDRVIKLMSQRDRIQGLDRTKEDTGTGSALVIGGDEKSYLAGLDRVIADPN